MEEINKWILILTQIGIFGDSLMAGYFPNATVCDGLKNIIDSQKAGTTHELNISQTSGIFVLFLIGRQGSEVNFV